MQQTYQAKLCLDANTLEVFEDIGAYYGKLKGVLYRLVHRQGGKCKDYKKAFCAKHALTARQFNALAVEVQGMIDGTRELLKSDKNDLPRNIKAKKSALKRAQEKMTKVNAGTLKLTQRKLTELKQRLYNLPKRIGKLEAKLKRTQARLAANAPGICFGSRKLFKAQFHLDAAGYASHEEWLAHWRAARSHQFFFIGSKDETAGNQSCVLTCTGLASDKANATPVRSKNGMDPSLMFKVRIRLPDALIKKPMKEGEKPVKHVEVEFKLSYGQVQVLQALNSGTALSYRFHRDNETMQWLVFISTDVAPAPKKSEDKKKGVLGIDFNADHLAVTQVDACGNMVKSWKVALPVEGKTSLQRKDLLSCALGEVVEYAVLHKLPIAAETLDFSAKKASMELKSKKYRVMLSGLMYAAYQQLLAAKCARAGIELIRVNPAYTSVIGRIKYATPFGRSVHLVAAGVIARRAKGCREKAPAVARVATGPVVSELRLPARTGHSSTTDKWRSYAANLRKTLFTVISAQKRDDKHRFKTRQQSSA